MLAKTLFTWSADYSVSIDAIDAQHKALIVLINELHQAIVEHRGQATACAVLDRVSEYTRSNFALEEQLMRASHYPDYEAHRQQHRALVDQLRLLRHRCYDDNLPIAFALLHILKNWLVRHINESDKHFGAHFAQALHEQQAPQRRRPDASTRAIGWPLPASR